MGAHVSRDDFVWSYTEEPHKTRRREILGECPCFWEAVTSVSVTSCVLPGSHVARSRGGVVSASRSVYAEHFGPNAINTT